MTKEPEIIFALGNDPKDCIPNEPQFMKDTHASHRAQRLLMLARGQHIIRKLSIKEAWFGMCKLHAEGSKLRAEGDKLYAEGNKLHAEGDKLRAEGNKLHAEGDKLYAEGSKLYAEGQLVFAQAVIDHHGPKTVMNWTTTGCTVEGIEHKFEEPI